jgi:hypothetical protein
MVRASVSARSRLKPALTLELALELALSLGL